MTSIISGRVTVLVGYAIVYHALAHLPSLIKVFPVHLMGRLNYDKVSAETIKQSVLFVLCWLDHADTSS